MSPKPAALSSPALLVRSFRCALRGAGCALLGDGRIHLLGAGAAVAAGALTGLAAAEWCWVVAAIAAVLAAEAMNSAVEALADAVHPQPHPLVGRAKDLAAGAVLLASLGAAAVGGLVFLPRWLA
jgi:diacylglycerol kinase (ATP)